MIDSLPKKGNELGKTVRYASQAAVEVARVGEHNAVVPAQRRQDELDLHLEQQPSAGAARATTPAGT